MIKKKSKTRRKYKVAGLDSMDWKCDWFRCAGGLGLAGNGWCSFKGDWEKRKCPRFISNDDFNRQGDAFKKWRVLINKIGVKK